MVESNATVMDNKEMIKEDINMLILKGENQIH